MFDKLGVEVVLLRQRKLEHDELTIWQLVDFLEKVNQLPDGQFIMLKLTLPEQDNFYAEFVKHPRVLRVVALSGGYSREEANNRLRKNPGVVASFSRALVE